MIQPIKLKLIRLREKCWFKSPYWLHVIDYKISQFFFENRVLFKLFKNKGLRYFPRKITYIDPNSITHYDRDRFFASIYYVQSGDWDLKKNPLCEKLQQKFVRELLVEKKSIENLNCLEEYLQKITNSATTRDQAMTIIRNKAEKCLDLCEKMKKDGYLTQKELGKSSWNRFNTWYDEIRVSMDRNGKYILNGSGNHRLAVAQVLKLKKVPAVVIRVHSQYYMDKKC